MAPTVEFPRALYPPSYPKGGSPDGIDVIAVKRAISRAGFFPWNQFDDTYSEKFSTEGVKKFQQVNGLTATGYYGEPTHERLVATRREDAKGEWAFDTTAIRMMEQADENLNKAPENTTLKTVRQMLSFCRLFDGPYVFGGEHDFSFYDDDVHDGFDCSSSVSFVLWKFKLMGVNSARVSGWFESWGESGRGKYITIHAADDHVWMEYNLPEGYYRFDTSPHGDGVHGPRVRTRRRSDSRFTHRYPKGY
jgi:hypothetical protein